MTYGASFVSQNVYGPTSATQASTFPRDPAIDEFKDTMVDVSLNVRGREMVDAGSRGKVEAWVAEVGPYTFWLTKEAPYVIRLTFVGARKNIAKWEIL